MKTRSILTRLPRLFFIIALAINIGIYFTAFFVVYFRESGYLDSFLIDFYSTYMKAVDRFLHRPLELYLEEGVTGIDAFWVLHNLPGVVFYYMPFFFIPRQDNLNLILYSACTLGWNLLACHVLAKLPSTKRWQEITPSIQAKLDPFVIMGLYLVCPLHVPEYALGQTNAIAGALIVCGFYFYMQGKDEHAFALVSASLYFKIIGLFLLVLVLFAGRKHLAKNLFFIVLVQLPNILVFIRYPSLIADFILLNVSAQETLAANGYRGFGTGSTGTISVFFTQNLGVSLSLGTSIALAFSLTIASVTLLKRRRFLNALEQWMLLLLLSAVVLPLFYLVHVFLYLGLFLYWLKINDGKVHASIKYLLAIPTFSIFFWFIFPFISFMYLSAFGAIIVKAWRVMDVSPGNMEDRERGTYCTFDVK